MATTLIMNNTTADIRCVLPAIIEAAKNGGVLCEDLADIFTLTKTPAGSAVEYVLNFA